MKRKNKIKRYLAVFKRRIKRLTFKKTGAWFVTNLKLKEHPFILGILFFIWINNILILRFYEKNNIARLLKFHLYIVIAWFILVIASNLLKDKSKVKWYLKKRFVFILLFLFSPLGLILLWSGAKFKKITRIILTVILLSLFVLALYHNKKYERLLSQEPVDRIVETISRPRKQTYLKSINKDALTGLQLATIHKKARIKLAVSDIASRTSAAAVSIKTKDKEGKELGMGSGFIISGDGIIATNFHVLESAYQAEVKVGESQFKEAYLIKGSQNLDIALLKIDAKNLSALPIGNSDSLVGGQFIVVLGNPWGFERSVSSGIISGIRSKGDIKLLQMTAPVSPGSSGGPVINEYGEVIGITTIASFFLAQNLNFAIPINNLKKLISEK